jgi:surface antigen
MKRIAMMALAASLAAACQITSDPDNKRAAGAVGGAILGVVAGYTMFGSGSGQSVMALLGAGAGGAGGYYVVDAIVKRDRKKRQKAAYESLNGGEVGRTVYWENQATGSAGSFTVLRSYRARDGRLCRDYSAKAMNELQTTDQRRTACRLADGGWELI